MLCNVDPDAQGSLGSDVQVDSFQHKSVVQNIAHVQSKDPASAFDSLRRKRFLFCP